MEYHVEITETALDDAEECVQFIRKVNKEPEAAEKWFRGLVSAIYSLEEVSLNGDSAPHLLLAKRK